MNDGIISATGNSRSIYGSLPSTYAEFKAAVEAGTQYIDMSYYAAGWQQAPTFLNKANLLKDATADLYGLDDTAVPDDVLVAARTLITAAQTTANGRLRIQTGSYTGTDVYGSSNENTLSFSFTPKIVIIHAGGASATQGYARGRLAIFTQSGADATASGGFNGTAFVGSTAVEAYRDIGSLSSNTLSWYNTNSVLGQMNSSDYTYYWYAIG